MSAPKRNDPKRGRLLADRLFRQGKGNGFLKQLSDLPDDLKEIKQRLLDYGADEAFERLVTGNCDPALLLLLLANVAKDGPDLDTWEARFGLEGPRELKGVIRRMRKCAEEFERLDKNGLLRLAAWPKFKQQFTPTQFLEHVSAIPVLLRGCADALDRAASNPRFKPRAHSFTNTALAQLVSYVQHCTGAPHDNEVSALVNAARQADPDHPYTADALKTWRDERQNVIRDSAQMFPSLFGR